MEVTVSKQPVAKTTDPENDVDPTLPKTSPLIISQMPNTTHATTSYHLPLLLCLVTLCFFPSLIGPILYSPFSLLSFSLSLLPWNSPTSATTTYTTRETAATATMSFTQKQFTLPAKSRGSYLITDTVLEKVPEIKEYKVGVLQLFVQHTSCALSLNENWDEDVR